MILYSSNRICLNMAEYQVLGNNDFSFLFPLSEGTHTPSSSSFMIKNRSVLKIAHLCNVQQVKYRYRSISIWSMNPKFCWHFYSRFEGVSNLTVVICVNIYKCISHPASSGTDLNGSRVSVKEQMHISIIAVMVWFF